MSVASFDVSPGSIAPQVIVGFCDLDGSSLKAIECLDAAQGCTRSELQLQIPGMPGDLKQAYHSSSSGTSACSSAATLINIQGGQGAEPKVSILAINAAIPEEKHAHVAAALVQLVASRQQGQAQGGSAACMYVLASTLVQHSSHKGVHLLCTSRGSELPVAKQLAGSCPVLPPAFQLKDNMLALLHHMSEATGTNACFLLNPGYRPAAGSMAEAESQEGAARLVAALMQGFGSEAAVEAGLAGVLTSDTGRAEGLSLPEPWFSSSGRNQIHRDNIYC